MSYELELWNSPNGLNMPTTISTMQEIINYNKQLSDKDVNKIIKAFNNELYDMAAEYVWTRAINILKSRILLLGEEFVMEMLGRSDTDSNEISEVDTINLAADLGFINKTAKLKLTQVSEIIRHYLSKDSSEEMDNIQVVMSIKTSIQYILGIEENDFEFSFNNFRSTLKTVLVKDTDSLFITLKSSPYFYKRTTIRTLLNLSKSSNGGELDIVLANMAFIIPSLWNDILSDDRYPIGIAYSEAVNKGDRQLVTALKTVLMKVNGFDYVPENLRSLSFIEYANKLREVHYDFNNFYNEPSAVRHLSNLGTTIPTPALGACISATLLSKLGNNYGRSTLAQSYVDNILGNLTQERWQYYINNVLPGDEDILTKLMTTGSPLNNWCDMVNEYKLNEFEYKNSKLKKILQKSAAGRKGEVVNLVKNLYNSIR